MMLVIGAITMLSIVTLTVNSMMLTQTVTVLDAEGNLNAVSMAQSMLDEIMRNAFDASAVTKKIYKASDFTVPASLGPSSTEAAYVSTPDSSNPPKSINATLGYNDIDDYHKYTRIVSNPRMGQFTITDTVYYVVETSPDKVSSTQTFMKKVVVRVYHQNMKKPLELSDVAIYRRYF